MSANASSEMRALSAKEIDDVSGANILIYGGPIVVGFAVGTAIRMGIDKLVSWLFD